MAPATLNLFINSSPYFCDRSYIEEMLQQIEKAFTENIAYQVSTVIISLKVN